MLSAERLDAPGAGCREEHSLRSASVNLGEQICLATAYQEGIAGSRGSAWPSRFSTSRVSSLISARMSCAFIVCKTGNCSRTISPSAPVCSPTTPGVAWLREVQTISTSPPGFCGNQACGRRAGPSIRQVCMERTGPRQPAVFARDAATGKLTRNGKHLLRRQDTADIRGRSDGDLPGRGQ